LTKTKVIRILSRLNYLSRKKYFQIDNFVMYEFDSLAGSFAS